MPALRPVATPPPRPGFPPGAGFPPRGLVNPVAAPSRSTAASSGSGVAGTLTAIVLAISAWLPWFKSPIGGLFELSGSTLQSTSVDAWGLPASSLWSQDARPGGLELGYLIVLLAIALLAFTWVAGLPRAGARLVGVAAMLVPVLWMIQIQRTLDRPQVVGFGDGPSITDFTGLGVYLMLIAGVVVALIGSGRVARV